MRLGEFLISQQVIDADALGEALESQVVHGGRLGTNLVELGLLSEQDLAKALGGLHKVAFASGNMNPDPRALELLDKDFCDDRDVLPMRVDQTRISVACINPHDLKTNDEIAFRTGKRVVTVVIPEFRMYQLLRKHCAAFRNIRAIDMDQLRPSRTRAAREPAQASPELMSEDEFQSLYAKVLKGDTAADPQEPAEPEVLQAVIVDEEPAAAPLAAPPPVATTSPAAQPPAPEVPQTPLSFVEAQKALAQSTDREDVALTVLRFAVGKWKRALLLNVQGPLVTGWHGLGENIREKAVRRIAVALRGQSTFKLVADTRSHFIGPFRRDAGTAVFYKLLGGDYPTTAVMLPLLVRGKVVHMLYVDNGPGQLTPPDIGELLILSQHVGRSYEAMINRRRSA